VEGQELRFRRNTFSHLTDKRFGLRQLSSVIIEELLRDEGVRGVDILTTQDRRILESQHCNIPAFQHPGGTSCQLPMLATNSAEPGEDKKYPCCQRRLFALPLHFSLNLYICA